MQGIQFTSGGKVREFDRSVLQNYLSEDTTWENEQINMLNRIISEV